MLRIPSAAAVTVACMIVGCGGSESSSLFSGGGAATGGASGGGGESGATGAGGGSGGGETGTSSVGGGSGANAAVGTHPCVLGTTAVCACGDGRSGARTCGASGVLSTCECEGGAPIPPPSSGDAGPDAGSACAVGHYTGTLIGSYQTASTLLPAQLPLNFPLDLTLTLGALPGVMVMDAQASGLYLFVNYTGHITGTVSCRTGKVLEATLTGSYGGGPLGATAFQGPVTGILDRSNGTLSGAWDARESNPTYGGTGTWTATAAP